MTPWQIAVGNLMAGPPPPPLDHEYECKYCHVVKPTKEFRMKKEKGCMYRCGTCRTCEKIKRTIWRKNRAGT